MMDLSYTIVPAILNRVVQQCRADLPDESCGILVGHQTHIIDFIPIQNVADKPESAFKLDQIQLLKALKQVEMRQQTLIGIYHSHPASRPEISATDAENARAQMPQYLHLIIGFGQQKPHIKGWHVTPEITEVKVMMTQHPPKAQRNALSNQEKIAIIIACIVSVLVLLLVALLLLPPAPPLPIR